MVPNHSLRKSIKCLLHLSLQNTCFYINAKTEQGFCTKSDCRHGFVLHRVCAALSVRTQHATGSDHTGNGKRIVHGGQLLQKVVFFYFLSQCIVQNRWIVVVDMQHQLHRFSVVGKTWTWWVRPTTSCKHRNVTDAVVLQSGHLRQQGAKRRRQLPVVVEELRSSN